MRGYALALLIAAGSPFLAAPAQAQSAVSTAIEACMRDLRSGLKAGQKMTEQQRMVAGTLGGLDRVIRIGSFSKTL